MGMQNIDFGNSINFSEAAVSKKQTVEDVHGWAGQLMERVKNLFSLTETAGAVFSSDAQTVDNSRKLKA